MASLMNVMPQPFLLQVVPGRTGTVRSSSSSMIGSSARPEEDATAWEAGADADGWGGRPDVYVSFPSWVADIVRLLGLVGAFGDGSTFG